MGTLSGAPAHPVTDPIVAAQESCGLFIAGDASILRRYGGTEPGSRWICRARGSLIEAAQGWPAAPGAHLLADEEQARALYGHLRNHALTTTPGLVPQDTRASFRLNAETAYAESFWLNEREVLRLFYDRVSDQEAMHELTDRVATFPSEPGNTAPPLIAFSSASAGHYLAVACGPTGAADHAVLIFSEKAQPEPLITGGMPGATRQPHLDRRGIALPSGVLVVHWGRFSGSDVLRHEDESAPADSLRLQLVGTVSAPITIGNTEARRLGEPGAYAVKMEAGTYEVAFYELNHPLYGRYACHAVSREGAPSFLPPAEAVPSPTAHAAAPAHIVAPTHHAAAPLAASDATAIEKIALQMIELAPDQVPANMLHAVRQLAPSLPASAVLERALKILQTPGRDDNPKFDALPKRVDPLARAHWLAMDASARSRHGSEADYAKLQLEAVCKANGVTLPSLGGFLGAVGRALRKL